MRWTVGWKKTGSANFVDEDSGMEMERGKTVNSLCRCKQQGQRNRAEEKPPSSSSSQLPLNRENQCVALFDLRRICHCHDECLRACQIPAFPALAGAGPSASGRPVANSEPPPAPDLAPVGVPPPISSPRHRSQILRKHTTEPSSPASHRTAIFSGLFRTARRHPLLRPPLHCTARSRRIAGPKTLTAEPPGNSTAPPTPAPHPPLRPTGGTSSATPLCPAITWTAFSHHRRRGRRRAMAWVINGKKKERERKSLIGEEDLINGHDLI